MNKWSCFAVLFLLTSSVSADEKVRGHIMPFSWEELSDPIKFSDNCSAVSVVEWKPTSKLPNGSYPSDQSSEIMNKVCNLAHQKFVSFVKSRGYNTNNIPQLHVEISLLPAHLNLGGTDYRNLNDIEYRFSQRSKSFDMYGVAIPIWGYYQRNTHHIYIRNDVLTEKKQKNSEFTFHFAHELFHALSYENGVYSQHNGDIEAREELLANIFASSLGI